jgi:hypothetical protein
MFQPAANNYLSEVFKFRCAEPMAIFLIITKNWTGLKVFLRRATEEDGTVASIISLQVLSSEMDPAEIRLIR